MKTRHTTPTLCFIIVLATSTAAAQQGSEARSDVGVDSAGTVESVVYTTAPTRNGPMELIMDLYRPAAGPVKGAVVLAHGGGFSGGSRTLQENADYGHALASRGYLAAAISYRLVGDMPVLEDGWARAYSRMVRDVDDPRLAGAIEAFGDDFTDAVAAAAVDQASAVSWLRNHAEEFGFAPDDIALFGASAGAISALTIAYAMEFHGADDVEVGAVIALRGLALLPEEAPNPFDAAGPPLLILHGEDDRRVLLSEAEQVFRMAREAGMPVELHVAPRIGHDLGAAGMLARRLDEERTVLQRMDDFLSNAFAGRPDSASGRRTRLLPARENGAQIQGASPDTGVPMTDTGFRQELEAAVRALLDAVAEESSVVASLYGVSKPELLRLDLDDPSRLDWSYWPRARAGLSLGMMTAGQRALAHRVLQVLLSAKGYLQVNHVMLLEEILAHRETAGFRRAGEDYAFSVFGDPFADRVWALRFEGHHVSLNVAVLPDRVTVTPSFLGAAPAPVEAGIRAGFNPLGHEQRQAFRLLASLDVEQREAAIVGDEAPSEILSSQFQRPPESWDRWRERFDERGVRVSTFDPSQRFHLARLLRTVARLYPDRVSEPWLAALDLDALTFAWMGSTDADQPHYFRIRGEDFLYEFDAAQEGGRHIHTVWRDGANDFGGEALLAHYRARAH